jgi:hypothetical protein
MDEDQGQKGKCGKYINIGKTAIPGETSPLCVMSIGTINN